MYSNEIILTSNALARRMVIAKKNVRNTQQQGVYRKSVVNERYDMPLIETTYSSENTNVKKIQYVVDGVGVIGLHHATNDNHMPHGLSYDRRCYISEFAKQLQFKQHTIMM